MKTILAVLALALAAAPSARAQVGLQVGDVDRQDGAGSDGGGSSGRVSSGGLDADDDLMGGASHTPKPTSPSDFKVVTRKHFAPDGGHAHISLTSGKYAIKLKAITHVPRRDGTQAVVAGQVVQFVTAGCSDCIDVDFRASISEQPGNYNVPDECKTRGVYIDGPANMRAKSEIKVAVDPAGIEHPNDQRWKLTLQKLNTPKYRVCKLKQGVDYYYNIAGDCDWATIETKRANGWDVPEKGKSKCLVQLVNNGANLFMNAAEQQSAPTSASARR